MIVKKILVHKTKVLSDVTVSTFRLFYQSTIENQIILSSFKKMQVFGLVESNWGGTRIEAWMPKEPLDACDIAPNVIDGNPQNSNSYLYNAMIHPLLRMSIKVKVI